MACFALLFAAFLPTDAAAQIHQVKEMNTEQIRALPRDKTAVLLPGGILEQHGPYLPSYTDGYQNESVTEHLAKAIVKRPGWHVLVFPVIPLGQGGANEIGDKHFFPGTYDVRASILRAIFMDLADDLGQQKFRCIFVVDTHGSPQHNEALDQAGDYFHDSYGGQMVNLLGSVEHYGETLLAMMTPKQREEEGFSVHADAVETSVLLHLRRDLVGPIKHAPPQTVTNSSQMVELARSDNWPGYFGSPRVANAALGKKAWKIYCGNVVERALHILDGQDPRQFPRYADKCRKTMPPAFWQAQQEVEDAAERQQVEWLKRTTKQETKP